MSSSSNLFFSSFFSFFPPLVGVVLLHQKFCSTGRGSKKINGTHFFVPKKWYPLFRSKKTGQRQRQKWGGVRGRSGGAGGGDIQRYSVDQLMNSSVKQLEPENRKFATLQPGGRGAAETEAKKGRWGWRESSKGLHKGRVLCKII